MTYPEGSLTLSAVDALARVCFSENDIEKIAYRNVLRVLKDSIS